MCFSRVFMPEDSPTGLIDLPAHLDAQDIPLFLALNGMRTLPDCNSVAFYEAIVEANGRPLGEEHRAKYLGLLAKLMAVPGMEQSDARTSALAHLHNGFPRSWLPMLLLDWHDRVRDVDADFDVDRTLGVELINLLRSMVDSPMACTSFMPRSRLALAVASSASILCARASTIWT